MRLLFDIDKKNYAGCIRTVVRHSARGIIVAEGRLAMIHSRAYGYYKFPGGGIEPDETPAQAMIRETREEAGLVVRPETVREFGYVHRIQQSVSDPAECFIQDNFYYLCQAEDGRVAQELDGYEAEEGFTLAFVEPEVAIAANRSVKACAKHQVMMEREARVIEMLMAEGLLK